MLKQKNFRYDGPDFSQVVDGIADYKNKRKKSKNERPACYLVITGFRGLEESVASERFAAGLGL
ncbi:hypothetical protein, partial [Pseudomonas helleri]|uniref:hypothetical protein n=1 Tax=Pseudomonas helleri TaxID=1608996 RepID=UPI003F9E634E